MKKSASKEINFLLDEVLKLPVEKRVSYLEEKTASNPELKIGVEFLLDGIEEDVPQGFLSPLLDSITSTPLLHRFSPNEDHIGNYKIGQLLGEGGMGSVFLAERVDGEFSHRVAIKIINRGNFSKEMLRRFLHERQILSELNHPNIAQLHDGGITDSGLPYFVMEYVDGEPIDRFCRTQGLSVNDILRLFLSLCEAVSFSHTNFVVHRDLKPANVLVNREQIVKLLDFGIAKLIGNNSDRQAPAFTVEGRTRLTYEYAAPEQVKPELASITTATDVYSLGIILYELLSGARPYSLLSDSAADIERVICNEIPKNPSTVVRQRLSHRAKKHALSRFPGLEKHENEQQKRVKLLRGDLDAIVQKAIKKEPSKRYKSVQDFIDDINRFLAKRPVRARNDTLYYRASKFFLRNFTAAILSVSLILALLIGAVTTTIQIKQKLEEASQKTTMLWVLEGLFETADPTIAQGRLISAQDLVNRNVQRINILSDQPIAHATLQHMLAKICLNLGLIPEADSLIQSALQVRQNHSGVNKLDIADSWNLYADMLRVRGQYSQSLVYYTKAYNVRYEYLGSQSAKTIESLNGEASVYHITKDYSKAVAKYNESASMLPKVTDDAKLAAIEGMDGLAALFRDQGNLQTADSLYREVLSLRSSILGEDAAQTAHTIFEYAGLLMMQKKLPQAKAYFERARTTYEKIFGSEHILVAHSVYALGLIEHEMLRQSDRLDQNSIVVEHYLRASEIYENANIHPQPGYMAYPVANLAKLYLEIGDTLRAEPLLRRRLEIYENIFSPYSVDVSTANTSLAISLIALGSYEEAEVLLLKTYNALFPKHNENPGVDRPLFYTLQSLVRLYSLQDMTKDAEQYRRQFYDIFPVEESNLGS